jgi:hypothetical protein
MFDRTNGAFNGMPWWVRAIALIGLPGVAAGWLIYFLTTHVDASHVAQEKAVTSIASEIAIHAKDTVHMIQQLELLKHVAQAACVNDADTQQERMACLIP